MYILKFGRKFEKEFSKIDKSISIQIFKKIEKFKFLLYPSERSGD